jgi:hypothetical protein
MEKLTVLIADDHPENLELKDPEFTDAREVLDAIDLGAF